MKRRRPIEPSTASQTPPDVPLLIGRCLSGKPDSAVSEISRRGLWEYVAAEACDAQMGAMLRERLCRQGGNVPVSAARQLQAYAEHVTAANAYQFQSVRKVLARLQIAKVPFLLLKGVALNAVLYKPGLRPMTDVDVLIHARDAAVADKVLRNAGCQPGPDLLREDFYPKYYCEREYFTGTHPPVKIDLHCRPFHLLRYARTVPESALWNDVTQAEFEGLTVRVPGPESMLIHLAVHAACHGVVAPAHRPAWTLADKPPVAPVPPVAPMAPVPPEERHPPVADEITHLRWLYDIRLWLDHFGDRIDFDRFSAKCRRWQLSLPVNRALVATQEIFGTSDPLDEAVSCTRGFAGPLQRLALFSAPLAGRAPLLHAICNVLTTPGLRFRLGYLAAVLLPERGHLGQIYSRRHPGWHLAAHATRLVRCLNRTSPAQA